MINKKIKFGLNIVSIFIVLFIVLYFSLKDNFDEIISYILNINYIYLIISIIFLILYRVFVSLSSYMLIELNKEKVGFLKLFQIYFIILFFHGVTPFASGGQPMEIYYLHKENISITKSMNIVLQNFILSQVSIILVGLFAVLYNFKFQVFSQDSLGRKLIILGFSINVLVLLLSCIISFNKRINKFVCNSVLSFFNKIKIIKNIDNVRDKLNIYLNNFNRNAKILLANKLFLVRVLIINILAVISYYSIAYILFKGAGISSISYIDSIVCIAYTMIIGSFVPIPGGTLGIEYGFIMFFSCLVDGYVLTAIMLLWRFISYYLGMIIGALCLMFYRKKEKICV